MVDAIDGDACPHREAVYCADGAMLGRVVAPPVRDDLACVDMRLPQVHLTGIEARRGGNGELTLRCPARTDRSGRHRPVFALQPGVAEAVAEAVTELWRRADQARHP